MMRFKIFYLLPAALSVLLFAFPAFAADAAKNCKEYVGPNAFFVGSILLILLIILLFAAVNIRNALVNASNWSLSDALSESSEVTNSNGDNILEMRASSSRLVAFMGMIAIMVLFIGFGTFALYRFAVYGELGESIDKVVSFLTAGISLFAPYAVNKFSKLFENIAQPKK
jgi:hypothetical protein